MTLNPILSTGIRPCVLFEEGLLRSPSEKARVYARLGAITKHV